MAKRSRVGLAGREVYRVAHRLRRRLIAQRLLNTMGWSLTGAMVAASLMVALTRLVSIPVPLWAFACVLLAAVVIGVALALRHPPSVRQAASLLDTSLNLHDRLGSAMLADQLAPSAFRDQLLDEARQTARKARPARVVPLRLRGGWAYLPVAMLLLAGLIFFLPVMDLAGVRKRAQERRDRSIQAQEDREQVERVVEQIRELEPQDPEQTPALASLDALAQLAAMTEEDLAQGASREEAAARLSQLQEELADAMQQSARDLEQLRSLLSRVETDQGGPADDFADALRRGDFEAAAKEAQRLAEQAQHDPNLSDADREAMANQLNQIQQQLEQLAQQAQSRAQEAQQQMAQTLEQAGMSAEQAQQMAQQMASGQMSPQQAQQAIQQALQQQNPNLTPQQAQQQAQQLAQQLQQQAGQCQSGQQAAQQVQQMAQQVQQMQQGQGGGQQQGQQAANSNALSQMAQMQQQMQQMQQMQQAAAGAMQQLGSQTQQSSAPSPTNQWGTGSGGHPLGAEHQPMGPYQVDQRRDLGPEGPGPVIASWRSSGPVEVGQPQVDYDQTITQARTTAERAIAEDAVPRRYHEAIKGYFDQLPDSPAAATQPPRPAPR